MSLAESIPPLLLERLDLLEAQGSWHQALALLRSSLSHNNPCAEVWHRLGRLYQRLNYLDVARRAYKIALDLDTARPNSFNNLILLELSCLDAEAADLWLKKGLAINDISNDDSDRLFASACELRLFQRRSHEALAFAKKQLSIKPSPVCLSNIAVCLRQMNDFSGAVEAQIQAIRLQVEEVPENLADLVGTELGSIDASVALHLQLMNLGVFKLCLDPFDRQAQMLLLAGAYCRAHYWHDSRFRDWLWRGRLVDELLVWDGRGFGDALQNLCWVRQLASSLGRIRLWLRPALHRLVRNRLDLPPNVILEVMDNSRIPWAEGCHHVDIWFLPIYMNGWQPGHPRLAAPALGRAKYLSDNTAIGLVWRAGRHSDPQPELSARKRDVPFPQLMAQARRWQKRWGCSLVSLQLDENLDPVVNEALARGWLNGSLVPGDWESTAEIVEKLSLVVTIDTAIAHLCGALGVSCVVLLNSPADWRWGQCGSDCFLYSSVRLARCPRPGAWLEALDLAENHVANFLDNR